MSVVSSLSPHFSCRGEAALAGHDEAVAEVPFGFGSVKEFESIMEEAPPWAAGFPIKAEGWRGPRYKK